MKISKLLAGALIALVFGAGIFIGSIARNTDTQTLPQTAKRQESRSDSVDEIIAAQEAKVEALQKNYDAAMSDLYSTTPPPSYRPDPELQRGMRQTIELNELICKQTGQNCELAAMTRRHYEEKYGPF